jgi:hypothetical protein
MTLAMEGSDATFTAWQRGNLAHAAELFGLAVRGEPVFGWRLRSVGAPATGPDGTRWLRVVSDYPEFACGDGWTGNLDANTLTGLTTPRVLDTAEWDDDGRRQRAEVMTLLPGQVISPADVLHQAAALPERWWAELRRTLDALRATPTRRVHADQDRITGRAQAALGRDLPIRRWETVHGDLHWNNLHVDPFGLVDWELWGRGPAGTDAASLYCHSLLVPDVAERVWAVFADVLDTIDGRLAQQAVAARMLRRIAGGDYPELDGPLRRHLAGLTRSSPARR